MYHTHMMLQWSTTAHTLKFRMKSVCSAFSDPLTIFIEVVSIPQKILYLATADSPRAQMTDFHTLGK